MLAMFSALSMFILMKKCLINVAVFNLCFPLKRCRVKRVASKVQEIFKIKN